MSGIDVSSEFGASQDPSRMQEVLEAFSTVTSIHYTISRDETASDNSRDECLLGEWAEKTRRRRLPLYQQQQQPQQRYAQQLSQMGANQMNGGQITPQMQAQLQAQKSQMGNPMQLRMSGGQNMMNGQNMNMEAMMQMQQQQQAMNNISALANQVMIQGQAIYNKQISVLAAKWGGAVENIPPDQMDSFKRSCMIEAKTQIQAVLAQRRAQQVMQQ
ncbi:hypothetical protein Ct61P_14785 [Colletotrichum tofieldiae]|nr:hypothetical protein Ct61P_14785 [Colletotrichum tofieldiae]